MSSIKNKYYEKILLIPAPYPQAMVPPTCNHEWEGPLTDDFDGTTFERCTKCGECRDV